MALLAGCRCEPVTARVEDQLRVTPESLEFPDTVLGSPSVRAVTITNRSRGSISLPLTVDSSDFTLGFSELELGGGDSVELPVTFGPAVATFVSATLSIGTIQVALRGNGKEPGRCATAAPCHSVTFDARTAACVDTTLDDGTACQTSCLAGVCAAGTCVGEVTGCEDDHDACTVAACDPQLGCRQLTRMCPAPAGKCQVASCDAQTGCGVAAAPDGTVCGVDDCTLDRVEVCITGQCVLRTRPGGGRCTNRWKPLSIPPLVDAPMAYDSARQRVVLYGKGTWEWDGAVWTQRYPPQSPPARERTALAFDEARQRVVLFGGSAGGLLDDTWEWDGQTWLARSPVMKPSPRYGHRMAYDPARRRVMLVGGWHSGSFFGTVDIWEWDGATWTERTTSPGPLLREGFGLTFDVARSRLVLYGGSSPMFSSPYYDTWEWDGSRWQQRDPRTWPRTSSLTAQIAYDIKRSKTVTISRIPGLMGGVLWEWDGMEWSERVAITEPVPRGGPALVYDAAREQMLMFGGYSMVDLDDTWLWDGVSWTPMSSPAQLPTTVTDFMSYDPARAAFDLARHRLVSFCRSPNNAPTLEWDGARWSFGTGLPPPFGAGGLVGYDGVRGQVMLLRPQSGDPWFWSGTGWSNVLSAAEPEGRYGAALAYDSDRHRVVLFGGASYAAPSELGDTWEWDGTGWTELRPLHSPSPRLDSAMAYDAHSHTTVLFSGTPGRVQPADTWEWNGSDWTERHPATSPPARGGHSMAYDPERERVVLLGSFVGMDTWEWDGTTWRSPEPNDAPLARGSLMWNDVTRRITLFDGVTLWEYLP